MNLTESCLEAAWPTSESLSVGQEGGLSFQDIDLTDIKDDFTITPSLKLPSACVKTSQFGGTSMVPLPHGFNSQEGHDTNYLGPTSSSIPLSDSKRPFGMHDDAYMSRLEDTEADSKTEVEYKPDQDSSQALEEDSQVVSYDTCLGVVSHISLSLPGQSLTKYRFRLKLFAHVVSSSKDNHGGRPVPVTIRRFGDMIKLYFQDTNKYAGLLTMPVLGKILDEFSIKFSPSLVVSKSQLDKTSTRTKGKGLERRYECSARIVVYGLKSEMTAVGDLLSDSDLFLQQPSATDCDRSIEYLNPHYLVRPGYPYPPIHMLHQHRKTWMR